MSGKSEASSALLDMRLQRMMGHLPALVNPAPRSVLVVGFGAGVTAGSFVPYPDVSSIVICELEPLIPPASDEFFGKENNHVLRDPRTRVIYDDARHYILISPEKFDIITTDPIHPWVKGTSTLYSREYYELVKSHLNPGGVAAQWLPIYESDEETVKTELATFFSVFPNATVWSNYLNGDGYDLVLLGSADPSPINVDALQRRLDQPSYSAVAASLAEVRFHSAVDLLATYAGRASDLAPMLANAQINDDLNMRLQYMAGLGLNSVSAPQVYREILSYRKFPEDLLVGEGDGVNTLHELIGRPHRISDMDRLLCYLLCASLAALRSKRGSDLRAGIRRFFLRCQRRSAAHRRRHATGWPHERGAIANLLAPMPSDRDIPQPHGAQCHAGGNCRPGEICVRAAVLHGGI